MGVKDPLSPSPTYNMYAKEIGNENLCLIPLFKQQQQKKPPIPLSFLNRGIYPHSYLSSVNVTARVC